MTSARRQGTEARAVENMETRISRPAVAIACRPFSDPRRPTVGGPFSVT